MWEDYRAELGERTRLLKGQYGTEADLDQTLEQIDLAFNKAPLKKGVLIIGISTETFLGSSKQILKKLRGKLTGSLHRRQ